MNRLLLHPSAKPVLGLLCALPFVNLLMGALQWGGMDLGANPAETLIRSTGDWTLRLLLATLAITPLRVSTGWSALARYRRMLGLFTFFYAGWHFLAFAWLDMGLDLAAIVKDIAKRPFILVGSAALLLMLPLALTSFNAAIRRLGGRRWQQLHRLVYAVALLGVLHFFWMRTAKNLLGEVAIYAAVLAVLLGWRVWHWRRKQQGLRAAGAGR